MSARRERAPTGASNKNSTRIGSARTNSGRDGMLNSNREEQLSSEEIITRLRDKKNKVQQEKDAKDIELMGDYNAFSRPRGSNEAPLRSVLLDPKVNNFPPSRTRSELMKRIKSTSQPHPSFDIDGDGWVSQEDYRLAKRFDFDGNGVLDPQEREIAKRVIADEFFKEHSHHLHLFGDKLTEKSHKQNVDSLANAYSFERTFNKLKQTEARLIAGAANVIKECISLPDDTLTKHNYFSDKFDTSAWNDFDAIPRSASEFGNHHNGSRKRLMFNRTQNMRTIGENKLDTAAASMPFINTRRSNMITNMAVENN